MSHGTSPQSFDSSRGIIFDLDGTLVDSRLDFDAIRQHIGLANGTPILEAIAEMTDEFERANAHAILNQYELQGASEAVLFDGVTEFLSWLADRGFCQAVLTRNSRASTEIVLSRLGLQFSRVLTREDAPPKPDPAGLLAICREWQLPPSRVLFCGDYLFDLEAGERAGMKTILFAPHDLPDFANRANFVLRSFRQGQQLLAETIELAS